MPNHLKYKTIFPLSQMPKSVVVAVTSSAYFSLLIIKTYKYEKTKLFSSSQE